MPVHQDNRNILRRIIWVQGAIVLVFLVFAVKLWQLTILDHTLYKQLAEMNRVRNIQVVAQRGIILDRHGRVLVDSIPSHNIVLMREEMTNEAETLAFLVRGLKLDRADLLSRLNRFRSTPRFQPMVIKEDVSLADIAYVRSHQRGHPELSIAEQPRRRYTYGQLGSHVLGYVGEVDDHQLNTEEYRGYRAGDVVGRYGIERTYNRILKGVDGKRKVVVDIQGRVHQQLEGIEPIAGKELYLTLDLDLQQVAEAEMADKAGAVVALDPRTGEVLVLASHPGFDPNDFAVRISRDRWAELVGNPARPLNNRVIQGTFSPGSTFKIVMAIAGLEKGLITPETSVYCPGFANIYGRTFKCHTGGHGTVTLRRAISQSCNVYFYHLGQRMGIDPIYTYSAMAGLGHPTGIDLPGEVLGLVPSQQWKKQTTGQPWYPGETISVSIGQGAVNVTPLQLARAIGGIAMGGYFPEPRLLFKIPQVPDARPIHLRTAHKTAADAEATLSERKFKAENVSRIIEGMWGVVNESGTGSRAAVAGFDVCGKTGTSQVIGYDVRSKIKDGEKLFVDNAWFVGFAPRDKPEIVVAVMVEGGGFGGVTSAPIAGKVLDAYYKKYVLPRANRLMAESVGSRQRAVGSR